MADLEELCEDALFELCDARERYPLRCANELQENINLKNNIIITKVITKPNVLLNSSSITERQKTLLNMSSMEENVHDEYLDNKLQNVTAKLANLKHVMGQIERERDSKINKALRK